MWCGLLWKPGLPEAYNKPADHHGQQGELRDDLKLSLCCSKYSHNTQHMFINSEGFQPPKQYWAPESFCCSFLISQLPSFVPSLSSLTLILRKEKGVFWK